MARHARQTWLERRTLSAAARFGAWAARTQSAWGARRPPARTGGAATSDLRLLRDGRTALGAVAAVAAAFALLFVLAGHPLRATPPAAHTPAHLQLAAPPRTPSSLAAGAAASDIVTGPSVGTGAEVSPGAVPTPPPAGPRPVVPAAQTPAAAAAPRAVAAAPAASTAGPSAPAASTAAPSESTASAAAPSASAVPAAIPASPPPPLVPPVPGEVLAGFGWAYSQVFGDWQEHTGVDLAGDIGQRVAVPGAGVVSAVRHDTLWGWVVSIALDHGYSTNVSGLARIDLLPGQQVRAGQTLGFVGASPPAEAVLPPHVFWQLFAGTRPIDPAQG